MSNRSIGIHDELYQYLLAIGVREDAVLRELREETASRPEARMQIAPEEGQLMGWLVQSLGVRRAIEVGVYTGYSALVVARALPPDGRLIACDVSAEFTSVARRYWQRAGVEERIDLRLAPALETLAELDRQGAAGTFDFAFIDADKANYGAYYDGCLALLRQGGVMMVDNVLWGGRVATPGHSDADTEAIRELNARIHADARVAMSVVPVADGITLIRKL